MAFSLLMCSAVIVLCILANRFLKRFGIPAVLIFIGLGMLFGSEGIVKIPFDNFQIAETICCTALIFRYHSYDRFCTVLLRCSGADRRKWLSECISLRFYCRKRPL